MRALLHDFPMIDDQNNVRLADGRKPVRNDKGRGALHQGLRGALDQLLRRGIHRAGGLVKHEDPGFGDDGPRKGNQLFFPGIPGEKQTG